MGQHKVTSPAVPTPAVQAEQPQGPFYLHSPTNGATDDPVKEIFDKTVVVPSKTSSSYPTQTTVPPPPPLPAIGLNTMTGEIIMTGVF